LVNDFQADCPLEEAASDAAKKILQAYLASNDSRVIIGREEAFASLFFDLHGFEHRILQS
jgi:hypothetical protein